ncbi:gamma subclass chorismate mutase AroQ [Nocardia sp. CA-129566]|uniref:gamma subclass chorismate mutase AroQ n=1 Tax=Nocardia sp. CA-129566 TaxID=3239976 RepID=UPI003D99EDC3
MFFRGSARVLVCVAAALLVAVPDTRAQPLDDDPSLDRIVALVTERLDTADAVAAAKWATAAQNGGEPSIDDPVREAQVYDAMARLGTERGLPEAWIRQVFFGQIEANKIVQRGLVTRWRFDPAEVPSTPPDLAAVRPVIDRVNVEIVDQLALRRAELTGPDCAERLAPSVFGVLTSGRADALHQAALVRAAAALCGP